MSFVNLNLCARLGLLVVLALPSCVGLASCKKGNQNKTATYPVKTATYPVKTATYPVKTATYPANTTKYPGVVIVGKVTGVSMLGGTPRNLKPWFVSMEVVRIERGKPPVKIGDIVTFQVHSVVMTFFVDMSEIVGKNFRITYDDGFAQNYRGNDRRIIARPLG